MDMGQIFCPVCLLSVFLCVCLLSTVTFDITFKPLRYAYSTSPLNETKVDDLILTVIFVLI